MLPWILAFVVFDVIVMLLVLRHVFARRAAAGGIAGGAAAIPSFLELRKFTDVIHPRIGEIVRANWSGDAMALPGVLAMALDEAEREARERGLSLDRDILKKLVESSLAKHGVGTGSQVREALRQVA